MKRSQIEAIWFSQYVGNKICMQRAIGKFFSIRLHLGLSVDEDVIVKEASGLSVEIGVGRL